MDTKVPDPPGDVAALYTVQQAKQGKQVFDKSCTSCHGPTSQGISAPPIGGATFLNKTKLLHWKVSDMRNVVVSSMPADNPGSLSKEQYAEVLAYLLAVNCYPAGSECVPTSETSALKQTKLHPIQGAKGEEFEQDLSGNGMRKKCSTTVGICAAAIGRVSALPRLMITPSGLL